MKEIKSIIEAYQKIDFSNNKAALATVVRVEGSSYRRAGARMLVSDSGEWIGGISGGCLEGDALKKARLAMINGKASLVTYDTRDDDPYQIGVGLGCNGIIDVLLNPLDVENPNNAVSILKDCQNSRTPNTILTVTSLKGEVPGVSLGDSFHFNNEQGLSEIFTEDELKNPLLAEIRHCQSTGKSQIRDFTLSDGTQLSIFIEIILPQIHLILFGGNYDIYPFVRLAREVGWKVSVVCNPLKVHRMLFELADAVLPKDASIETDDYTVAVLMAHDYETDLRNLKYLLKGNIPYIGMLGPRKRTDKMFAALAEENNPVKEEDEERIFSPVGLDIGASTPEEIAISIIAEIRMHFANREGGRLKYRNKPIYE
ncbi:XdhC and CoxI family protein [Pseudarcicella hirudinis]|uniref:XdhC and CoxI family protein n=1 Tax=Pseudarcicella hirudinis TaxID=1079859 RepID=A0A1I5UVM2_9BACT|nr:XdhC family protein [Pseudarcicella hirudinis]SFP99293.1 XdhC and CoxI family protein [Pseudarcicella hirudinis]